MDSAYNIIEMTESVFHVHSVCFTSCLWCGLNKDYFLICPIQRAVISGTLSLFCN